ncbi:hypothetical protein RUND412_002896 [Rhizina undulata]
MKSVPAFLCKKAPRAKAGLDASPEKPELSSWLIISSSSKAANVQESDREHSATLEPPSHQKKETGPGRYSSEQGTWLLDYVEHMFDGIKLSIYDWEIVAETFEEKLGIKRKPGALAQKWMVLERMAQMKEEATAKKRRYRFSDNEKQLWLRGLCHVE